MARVRECVALSQISTDTDRMPMGYESLVGDMGSTLSGGQKQRVLITRVICRRPRTLLLDERSVNAALSALAIAHKGGVAWGGGGGGQCVTSATGNDVMRALAFEEVRVVRSGYLDIGRPRRKNVDRQAAAFPMAIAAHGALAAGGGQRVPP